MGALSFLQAKSPAEKSPADLTIRAAFEVWRELGRGMSPRIYRQALAVELAAHGVRVAEGAELTVKYRGRVVGELAVDLLVAEQVVVGIRAQQRLLPAELIDQSRLLQAVRLEQGLLLNFGAMRLEYRRLSRAG